MRTTAIYPDINVRYVTHEQPYIYLSAMVQTNKGNYVELVVSTAISFHRADSFLKDVFTRFTQEAEKTKDFVSPSEPFVDINGIPAKLEYYPSVLIALYSKRFNP